MRKVKLLLVFVFVLVLSINVSAQSQSNTPTYYKITFNVDEFQLKELIPACSEIFAANAENKGEPNVLYFNSSVAMTSELLQEKLQEKNITYTFELNVIENEK